MTGNTYRSNTPMKTQEDGEMAWMGSYPHNRSSYMNILASRGFWGRGDGDFYGCYFQLTEEMKGWFRGEE